MLERAHEGLPLTSVGFGPHSLTAASLITGLFAQSARIAIKKINTNYQSYQQTSEKLSCFVRASSREPEHMLGLLACLTVYVCFGPWLCWSLNAGLMIVACNMDSHQHLLGHHPKTMLISPNANNSVRGSNSLCEED